MAASAPALAALEAIDDEELGAVVGQSLFVGDFIAGNASDPNDGRFDFHRMGLDVELAMNANIDKLQLGCGGFNESIASNSCDIDMDYVRLMGLNDAKVGPSPDGPLSDFVLRRPYIEIAVTGGGVTDREVAGIKIGSESANGYFGIGRTYANDTINEEFGGTCGSGSPEARLACHTGLNRVSGYLNAELSGKFDISTGLGDGVACIGVIDVNGGECAPGSNSPFVVEIVGSRLREMLQPGVPLKIDDGLFTLLKAIGLNDAYSTIQQSLRFIHGFALDDTDDFYLAFQREMVAYPTYDKSGYAYPANAGWWMNVPYVAVRNFTGQEVTIGGGIGGALSALGRPGPLVRESELNTVPPSNCYGGYAFC